MVKGKQRVWELTLKISRIFNCLYKGAEGTLR